MRNEIIENSYSHHRRNESDYQFFLTQIINPKYTNANSITSLLFAYLHLGALEFS